MSKPFTAPDPKWRLTRMAAAKGHVRMHTAIASCCMALVSATVSAADVPPDVGAVQRLEQDQLERYRQNQLLQQAPVKPTLTVPEPPEATTASRVRNIAVVDFKVDKSDILRPQEVSAALAPYTHQTLSLADLFEAVAAINRLYADKNMPTARAVLPPQDIQDGLVHIQLMESRMGATQIAPLAVLQPSFIQDRLSLQPGDLFSVPILEADLVRFNRLHEARLSASLQAGTEVGTTDVLLAVAEPSRFQFSSFTDNAGRTTVGAYRWGVTATVADFSGHDDKLALSAVTSSGTHSYALNYSLPITRSDLRFDIGYNKGSMQVVSGAFAPLDIGGNSSEWSMGLVQPLVVDGQRLWNVYGRSSKKHSVSDFGGVSQTPVELFSLTAGLSGQQLNDTSAWTVDINGTEGFREFSGQVVYAVFRMNAGWRGRASDKSQVILRGALQYSTSDTLPSVEEFQSGGSASVRGYPEGMLSGRQGFLSSIEWQYALNPATPNAAPNSNVPQWTSLVFMDVGGAFPYRPAPLNMRTHDDYLAGIGVGLSMEWKRNIAGRLAVAWPLRSNAALPRQNESRLMASLMYSWP